MPRWRLSAPVSCVPATRVLAVRRAMGTLVRVLAAPGPRASAAELALDEIERIERLMSVRRPDSDLGRVNAGSGKPVEVSVETFHVLEWSARISRLSAGAFDVTVEALSELWRFGDTAVVRPSCPDPRDVARRLTHVGWARVELDAARRTVRIPPGSRIGLGGMAKGYAVDRAARILCDEGIGDFILQGGGDLFASGRRPDGAPWTIGVRDPRARGGAAFAAAALSDRALCTAGDYERFFMVDGVRYHHVLDPRTGDPARASRSVSIIADSAMLADGLDDAIFVLGPNSGLELARRFPGVEVLIVDAHNSVWSSSQGAAGFQVHRAPSP
jgi:thiamine biosynthesis lipoprotein